MAAPRAAGVLAPPLLLLLAQLLVTDDVHGTSQQNQPCGHDEYNTNGLCCKLCAAGQQVSEHCTSPHTKSDCVTCANGTFAVHPNGDTSCFPCFSCSKDQEMVEECTPTSDTRCRCPHGSFFNRQGTLWFCRPCTNCTGGRVLQQCSATRDAVCGEGNQDSWFQKMWIIVIVGVLGSGAVVFICRNRESARASTDSSHRSRPTDQVQLPEDTEMGQPARSEQLKALMQNGGSASAPGHPGISEDPVEDIELLEVVVNGNPVHTVGMRQHQDPSDPESGGALPQCSGAGLLSVSEDSPGRNAPRLSARDGLHTADHPTAQHGGQHQAPAEGCIGLPAGLCLPASAESQVWKRNSEPQHSALELRSCCGLGPPNKENLPHRCVRDEVYLSPGIWVLVSLIFRFLRSGGAVQTSSSGCLGLLRISQARQGFSALDHAFSSWVVS